MSQEKGEKARSISCWITLLGGQPELSTEQQPAAFSQELGMGCVQTRGLAFRSSQTTLPCPALASPPPCTAGLGTCLQHCQPCLRAGQMLCSAASHQIILIKPSSLQMTYVHHSRSIPHTIYTHQ